MPILQTCHNLDSDPMSEVTALPDVHAWLYGVRPTRLSGEEDVYVVVDGKSVNIPGEPVTLKVVQRSRIE